VEAFSKVSPTSPTGLLAGRLSCVNNSSTYHDYAQVSRFVTRSYAGERSSQYSAFLHSNSMSICSILSFNDSFTNNLLNYSGGFVVTSSVAT
jgi:hypothetical protein